MPLTPHDYLRVLSDAFTPVRDLTGRLLGCVPRVPDNTELLRGTNGAVFELHISAQACVRVNLDDPSQNPHALAGFTPLDDTHVDLAIPVHRGGDDPDIATGV